MIAQQMRLFNRKEKKGKWFWFFLRESVKEKLFFEKIRSISPIRSCSCFFDFYFSCARENQGTIMKSLFWKEVDKMKENSELKKLAQSAKNRLKKGYWQGASTAEVIPANREDGIGYALEEEMYAKVREMLSGDECVIDPIGRLIDKAKFSEMDFAERNRYVLDLSKIYIRLKDRYFREKNRKKS
ncbi:MAG TPA: hypothetical protein DHV31_01565 [Clostridiales bacterium]|nr:hypothetical protein [Clostridiales bacterium]